LKISKVCRQRKASK